MENKYLKLKVVKLNCFIAIEVMHMDERFRAIGNKENIFKSSNNFWLYSYKYPNMDALNVFFIRGMHKDKDHQVSRFYFKSNDDRDKYIENLKIAVSEFPKWFEKLEIENTKEVSNEDILIIEC